MKWDTGIICYEKERLTEDFSYLVYKSYHQTQGQLGFEGRDFFEKGMQFWHDDAYYHYTSSVMAQDQSGKYTLEAEKPFKDGFTRANTSFAIMKLERITEGKHKDKIKMTSLQSIDIFASVPKLIMEPALKKQAKSWVESLTKWYTKNWK